MSVGHLGFDGHRPPLQQRRPRHAAADCRRSARVHFSCHPERSLRSRRTSEVAVGTSGGRLMGEPIISENSERSPFDFAQGRLSTALRQASASLRMTCFKKAAKRLRESAEFALHALVEKKPEMSESVWRSRSRVWNPKARS